MIRSYTKFVMGVRRELPQHPSASCCLWGESSWSGGRVGAFEVSTSKDEDNLTHMLEILLLS